MQPPPAVRDHLGEEGELVGARVVDRGSRTARARRPPRAADVGVGDVEARGRRADLGRDRAGALVVDVADHDVGALGGEPARDRGADPAGAAGDQRPSSLEPHRGGRICRARNRLRRRCRSGAASPIPIIGGTGALGFGLALRWARAGRAGRDRLAQRRARRRGARAGRRGCARTPRSRASSTRRPRDAGPVVFLTVPFRAQSENLNNLREALEPGQLLVDCTVPLAAAVSGKATRSLGVWQGSAAQQAQEMVPEGVTVVAALHTVERPDARRPGRRARRGRARSAATARPTRRGSPSWSSRSPGCARSTPGRSRWRGSSSS